MYKHAQKLCSSHVLVRKPTLHGNEREIYIGLRCFPIKVVVDLGGIVVLHGDRGIV